AAFLRALPFGLAFPTLSDLSDPISSVLSSRPLLFRGFLSGVSDFIRSSEPDFRPSRDVPVLEADRVPSEAEP
ncbi:hypothetical protein, partial [Streptomyces galbus]|uniref:hypothetical protein n=2 Tax=Streptomyces galbus TaxID=33898 RepID=UPI001E421292